MKAIRLGRGPLSHATSLLSDLIGLAFRLHSNVAEGNDSDIARKESLISAGKSKHRPESVPGGQNARKEKKMTKRRDQGLTTTIFLDHPEPVGRVPEVQGQTAPRVSHFDFLSIKRRAGSAAPSSKCLRPLAALVRRTRSKEIRRGPPAGRKSLPMFYGKHLSSRGVLDPDFSFFNGATTAGSGAIPS